MLITLKLSSAAPASSNSKTKNIWVSSNISEITSMLDNKVYFIPSKSVRVIFIFKWTFLKHSQLRIIRHTVNSALWLIRTNPIYTTALHWLPVLNLPGLSFSDCFLSWYTSHCSRRKSGYLPFTTDTLYRKKSIWRVTSATISLYPVLLLMDVEHGIGTFP